MLFGVLCAPYLVAGPAERCDLICVDERYVRDRLQDRLDERGLACTIGPSKDMEGG